MNPIGNLPGTLCAYHSTLTYTEYFLPLPVTAHDTFHHLRTFSVHSNRLHLINAPYQLIRNMYICQCPECLIQKLQHLGLIVRFSCIIPGQIHKIESIIGTFYIRTQFLEIIGNRGRHQRIRCPPLVYSKLSK